LRNNIAATKISTIVATIAALLRLRTLLGKIEQRQKCILFLPTLLLRLVIAGNWLDAAKTGFELQ
jgi:hypothetical protein